MEAAKEWISLAHRYFALPRKQFSREPFEFRELAYVLPPPGTWHFLHEEVMKAPLPDNARQAQYLALRLLAKELIGDLEGIQETQNLLKPIHREYRFSRAAIRPWVFMRCQGVEEEGPDFLELLEAAEEEEKKEEELSELEAGLGLSGLEGLLGKLTIFNRYNAPDLVGKYGKEAAKGIILRTLKAPFPIEFKSTESKALALDVALENLDRIEGFPYVFAENMHGFELTERQYAQISQFKEWPFSTVRDNYIMNLVLTNRIKAAMNELQRHGPLMLIDVHFWRDHSSTLATFFRNLPKEESFYQSWVGNEDSSSRISDSPESKNPVGEIPEAQPTPKVRTGNLL